MVSRLARRRRQTHTAGDLMRARLVAVLAALGILLGLVTAPATATTPPPPPPGASLCSIGNLLTGNAPDDAPTDVCASVVPTTIASCHCDYAFDYGTVEPPVGGDIVQGIHLLGEANVTGDPADRSAAQADFAAAANAVGGAQLGQPTVGYIDPVTGSFVPHPDQWRVGVGNHFTNGLNRFRQGQPTAGMNEFDTAYQELIDDGSAEG